MEKNSKKFSIFKWIGCIFKALFTFVRYGYFAPHLYGEEEVTPAYIAVRGNKFRLAETLDHRPDEKIYLNAGYITYHCLCCGKKSHAWTENYTKYVMENK